MEYERTEDGQIQADFAKRAGQLLVQYEICTSHLSAEKRFEATLCISLLQSMLTNAAELLKGKKTPLNTELRAVAEREVNKEPTLFGLEPTCITKQWTSTRGLRYREVIECLRNALSHPLPQLASEGLYPTTGYTSWRNPSGVIDGFTFVQSPFIGRSGKAHISRFMSGKGFPTTREKLEEEMCRWAENYEVPHLNIAMLKSGVYAIFQRERVFVPVLRLDLSTASLRIFTLALSDLLSEPLDKERHMKEIPVRDEYIQ